jgi:hypothetical protein
MCTALWLTRPDGWELHFNRDESTRRGPGEPPAVFEVEGVRVVAPRDSDAGGTWIGVNQYGLGVALLNGADLRSTEGDWRSRGLLVRELLAMDDPAAIADRIRASDPDRHRAFTLLVLAPGQEARIHEWNGQELTAAAASLPLASSSLDHGRARTERRRLFEHWSARHGAGTTGWYADFLRTHEPERGPWSPCMHRDDACTVSATHVRVDAQGARLRYAPGPPCSTVFGAPHVLPR